MFSLMPFGGRDPFRGFEEIERQLMDFSDMHTRMMQMPFSDFQVPEGQGHFQMYTQSFVQSSKMGPDGRMITEKYFDKSHVGKGRDGNTISERQQGYKNTGSGVDKFAHERMLNDQGRKFLKERDRTGQVTTTQHYYNLDENQKDQFDQRWNNYGKQIGFGDMPKQIQQGPSSNYNYQNQPIGYGNDRPFPVSHHRQSEQLALPDTPNVGRRATDLQPTNVGQRTPMRAIPPTTNTRVVGRGASTQPALQQQHHHQQPMTNQQRPANRNEELTGVYRNKNARNYPHAG